MGMCGPGTSAFQGIIHGHGWSVQGAHSYTCLCGTRSSPCLLTAPSAGSQVSIVYVFWALPQVGCAGLAKMLAAWEAGIRTGGKEVMVSKNTHKQMSVSQLLLLRRYSCSGSWGLLSPFLMLPPNPDIRDGHHLTHTVPRGCHYPSPRDTRRSQDDSAAHSRRSSADMGFAGHGTFLANKCLKISVSNIVLSKKL